MREVAWFEGECQTHDHKNHNYFATERHSLAGIAIVITFEEFGSFTAYSEEEAIFVFQEWYKENVKAPEDDMRDKIRQPPLRNDNRDI